MALPCAAANGGGRWQFIENRWVVQPLSSAVAELGSLGISCMITQEYNKGVSFRITIMGFTTLCRAVESVSGVVFTKRRRFFWSVEDVGAEFTFRGHSFTISTDEWDGALWIMTKDGQEHLDEMQVLRERVEQRASASWVYRLLSWRIA